MVMHWLIHFFVALCLKMCGLSYWGGPGWQCWGSLCGSFLFQGGKSCWCWHLPCPGWTVHSGLGNTGAQGCGTSGWNPGTPLETGPKSAHLIMNREKKGMNNHDQYSFISNTTTGVDNRIILKMIETYGLENRGLTLTTWVWCPTVKLWVWIQVEQDRVTGGYWKKRRMKDVNNKTREQHWKLGLSVTIDYLVIFPPECLSEWSNNSL